MTKLIKILFSVALLAFLAAGCSLDTPDPATLVYEQPEGAGYLANYVSIGMRQAGIIQVLVMSSKYKHRKIWILNFNIEQNIPYTIPVL